MQTVAPGVHELRFRSEDGQFRTFYLAAHQAGILVFHAFVKKVQQTPQSEINTARRWLKELIDGQE